MKARQLIAITGITSLACLTGTVAAANTDTTPNPLHSSVSVYPDFIQAFGANQSDHDPHSDGNALVKSGCFSGASVHTHHADSIRLADGSGTLTNVTTSCDNAAQLGGDLTSHSETTVQEADLLGGRLIAKGITTSCSTDAAGNAVISSSIESINGQPVGLTSSTIQVAGKVTVQVNHLEEDIIPGAGTFEDADALIVGIPAQVKDPYGNKGTVDRFITVGNCLIEQFGPF